MKKLLLLFCFCCVSYFAFAQSQHFPISDFSIDQSVGCYPLKVQFQDKSTSNADSIIFYHWDFGDGSSSDKKNPVHIYTQPGQYYASLTVKNNLNFTSFINSSELINVGPLAGYQSLYVLCSPTVELRNDIYGALPFTKYLWSTGATTDHITVTQFGIYKVNISQCDTTITDSVQVVSDTTKLLQFSQSQPDSCNTLTRIFKFKELYKHDKQDTITGQIDFGDGTNTWLVSSLVFKHTYPQPGNYKVTVDFGYYNLKKDGQNCEFEMTANVPVDYSSVKVNLGADTSLCAGDSIQLNAGDDNTDIQWSTGATTKNITVHEEGQYWVTEGNDGCTASDTINIITHPEKPDIIERNDTLLSSVNADNYQWYKNGKIIPSATQASFIPDEGGNYLLATTDKSGCSASSAAYYYKSVDSLMAGFTISGANGCAPLHFLATPDNTMNDSNVQRSWFINGMNITDSSTLNYLTYTIKQAGSYQLKSVVRTTTGVDSVVKKINVSPAPAFDLGVDTTICEGSSIKLSINGGGTYYWSTGETTDSITVKGAGLYYGILTKNGCSAIDSITIKTVARPDAAVTLSNGLLSASPAAAYQWLFNGKEIESATAQTYQPERTGDYTVRESNSNGCSELSDVYHYENVTDNLKTAFIMDRSSGCAPLTVHFQDASTAKNDVIIAAEWSFGNGDMINGTNAHYTFAKQGTYDVRLVIHTEKGVWDTLSKSINVYAKPIINLIKDTSLCEGQPLILDAGNNDYNYHWSTGDSTSSTSISEPGMYEVEIGNESCTIVDTIIVNTIAAPLVSLGPDTTICAGSSFTLNAGNEGASYQWSTGATTPTIQVWQDSIYSVKVTKCNITATDSIKVTFDEITPPLIHQQNDTLYTSQYISYQWYRDGQPVTGATSQLFIPEDTGAYMVMVYNEAGCSASSAYMTINNLSIYREADKDISLYPNPASGVVNIKIDNQPSDKAYLQVYNDKGRLIFSDEFSGEQYQLNLSGKEKGYYFINIKYDGKQQTVRMLIL